MSPSPAAAVSAFARRATAAVFAVAMCKGVLGAALVLAGAQLGMRLAGGYLAPSWHWLWLAAPVLAYAVWCARRERLSTATAAAHLDRRLGLGGLLLAAHAGNEMDAAYAALLASGLRGTATVLPQADWSRALPLPCAAAALAAVLGLLPAPAAAVVPAPAELAKAQLEQITVAMRDLFDRGAVPEEVQRELEQRLGELQQRAEAGQAPDWRDLDDLEVRLDREKRLQELASLARAAAPAVRGGAAGAAAIPSAKQLAELAKTLADTGLLEKLAPQLQEMLRNARLPDGTFDPALLAMDPALLQEMLGKFGDLARQLGPLAEGLDPAALRELQRLAQEFGQGFGQGGGAGRGEGEQGGRGTGEVGRGPGHAALQLSEDARGGADSSLRLPPGAPLPGDWVPVGSTARPAETAAVANTAAGGDAAQGAGGATWQLHLAPRHRQVVRRFFGTEAGATTESGGAGPTGSKDPGSKDKR